MCRPAVPTPPSRLHQVLPYRPEAWAKLARLYRFEKNDFERCWSYAAAGLAQGPARISAHSLDPMVGFSASSRGVGCGVGLPVGDGHHKCPRPQ